jgi:hypothetical protein
LDLESRAFSRRSSKGAVVFRIYQLLQFGEKIPRYGGSTPARSLPAKTINPRSEDLSRFCILTSSEVRYVVIHSHWIETTRNAESKVNVRKDEAMEDKMEAGSGCPSFRQCQYQWSYRAGSMSECRIGSSVYTEIRGK